MQYASRIGVLLLLVRTHRVRVRVGRYKPLQSRRTGLSEDALNKLLSLALHALKVKQKLKEEDTSEVFSLALYQMTTGSTAAIETATSSKNSIQGSPPTTLKSPLDLVHDLLHEVAFGIKSFTILDLDVILIEILTLENSKFSLTFAQGFDGSRLTKSTLSCLTVSFMNLHSFLIEKSAEYQRKCNEKIEKAFDDWDDSL